MNCDQFETENSPLIQQVKQQQIGMSEEQIKQVEEWTMMRCKNVIFDSDVDDNRLETSQLETKIIGKQSLLFIIDDSNGN